MKIFVFSLITGSALSCVGQEIIRGLPALPDGFSSRSAISNLPRLSLKNGLGITTTLALQYDTNVLQKPSGQEKEDLLVSPGVTISYGRAGANFLFGANVTANYDTYAETTELNALNYSSSAYLGYKSDKLVVGLSAGFSDNTGVNRFTSSILEQRNTRLRLRARYKISSKTSLLATTAYSDTLHETAGFIDNSSLNSSVAALWDVTPLISLGPGLRWTERDSENGQTLESLGPTLRLNYQLSEKVKIRSRVGVSKTDFGNGQEDDLLNWSASVNYKANALWSLEAGLVRDTQATFTSGGTFNEVTSYSITYRRKIGRVQTGLAFDYEQRESTNQAASLNDSEFLSVGLFANIPVLAERGHIAVSLKYRDFDSVARPDWSGFLYGIGFRYQF